MRVFSFRAEDQRRIGVPGLGSGTRVVLSSRSFGDRTEGGVPNKEAAPAPPKRGGWLHVAQMQERYIKADPTKGGIDPTGERVHPVPRRPLATQNRGGEDDLGFGAEGESGAAVQGGARGRAMQGGARGD